MAMLVLTGDTCGDVQAGKCSTIRALGELYALKDETTI